MMQEKTEKMQSCKHDMVYTHTEDMSGPHGDFEYIWSKCKKCEYENYECK